MHIFWQTIASYNAATWIFQIVLFLTGAALAVRLIRQPTPRLKTGMKIYLIALYLWIAAVYYYLYCAERSYTGVMALFWMVMALVWVWDAATGYTTFERSRKYDALAYTLLVLPLFYPAISLARGLSFPGVASPVMPSPVAAFTMGLLLLFVRRVNMLIVLFLCHWSLIGLSKTYAFDIPEDFLLAGASVPALYFFFREFYLSDPERPTKPAIRYIDWLLIGVCTGIGVLLLTVMLRELLHPGAGC